MNLKILNLSVCGFLGAGTEARPVRQRLSDSAGRDPQLYQIAFADG